MITVAVRQGNYFRSMRLLEITQGYVSVRKPIGGNTLLVPWGRLKVRDRLQVESILGGMEMQHNVNYMGRLQNVSTRTGVSKGTQKPYTFSSGELVIVSADGSVSVESFNVGDRDPELLSKMMNLQGKDVSATFQVGARLWDGKAVLELRATSCVLAVPTKQTA